MKITKQKPKASFYIQDIFNPIYLLNVLVDECLTKKSLP